MRDYRKLCTDAQLMAGNAHAGAERAAPPTAFGRFGLNRKLDDFKYAEERKLRAESVATGRRTRFGEDVLDGHSATLLVGRLGLLGTNLFYRRKREQLRQSGPVASSPSRLIVG